MCVVYRGFRSPRPFCAAKGEGVGGGGASKASYDCPMRQGTRNTKASSIAKSRSLRKEPSASEAVIWGLLRRDQTGFRFRRQYAAGPYVLDFFCPEADLCLEVDGEQHALRTDRDAQRDAWLAARGIETYRLPTLDIWEPTSLAVGRAIENVVRRCEERSGRARFDRTGRAG